MQTLFLILAIASATMSGIFYAFSSFLMRSLNNLGHASGIRAMQQINIDVLCWTFLLPFFTLTVAYIGVGIYAVTRPDAPGRMLLLIASFVYVAGSLLVTMFGNVPLNNQLALADPENEAGIQQWQNYLQRWTRLNHIRTFASIAAAMLLLWGA